MHDAQLENWFSFAQAMIQHTRRKKRREPQNSSDMRGCSENTIEICIK
jgi:hypothetical protein